jgi:hypothetical protein
LRLLAWTASIKYIRASATLRRFVDYRLITVVQYVNGVMMIRFFGSHEEYDKIDAETV